MDRIVSDTNWIQKYASCGGPEFFFVINIQVLSYVYYTSYNNEQLSVRIHGAIYAIRFQGRQRIAWPHITC